MKHITFYILSITVLFTSCKKFLDVNSPNPNQPISSTAQLLLPTALVGTANYVNVFNSNAAQSGLYMANAGGYGGFGSVETYNYSNTDLNGGWNIYDVMEDYFQVKELSAEDPDLRYFNAVARIMLSHGFQLLVDNFNSVPYFEALKGGSKLYTAKFDEPDAIYADLVKQIDAAIKTINEGLNDNVPPVKITKDQDPMFGGDMVKWKKFANTLKLRIIIRANGKVTFDNTTFTDDGFLTTDAMVNPGYMRDNGKQNPKWNSWGFTYTGGTAGLGWMPSTYAFSFYNGKLYDEGRGYETYYKFPNTPTNRLGSHPVSLPASPSGSSWLPSDNRTGTSAGNAPGVLKGPDASMPIITAAESYFWQAEAKLSGLLSEDDGDVKTFFNKGIDASFNYIFQLPDGTLDDDAHGYYEQYLEDNDESYLVNFDLATSSEKKLEAIITQKFIALNMVNSEQALADFRRTGYPAIVPFSSGASGTATFASASSQSTRADGLPTRWMYPTGEVSANPNVPTGISTFTSLIFWAKQ